MEWKKTRKKTSEGKRQEESEGKLIIEKGDKETDGEWERGVGNKEITSEGTEIGRGGWRNGNKYIKCRNSLGHMAPPGLTEERYISHWATKFGKDSNPGRQHQRPKTRGGLRVWKSGEGRKEQ